MKHAFWKKYNECIPVYALTLNCSYHTINADWRSKYFGDDLSKVYDFYIAYFSKA